MSKVLSTTQFSLQNICNFDMILFPAFFFIFLNKNIFCLLFLTLLFCHKHVKLYLRIRNVSNDTKKIFELFKIYEGNRLPSIFNHNLLLL